MKQFIINKIKSIAWQYGLFRTKTLICFPHSIPFPISQMPIFFQILVYNAMKSTSKHIFLTKIVFVAKFYIKYTVSRNLIRILYRKRLFPAILIKVWLTTRLNQHQHIFLCPNSDFS